MSQFDNTLATASKVSQAAKPPQTKKGTPKAKETADGKAGRF